MVGIRKVGINTQIFGMGGAADVTAPTVSSIEVGAIDDDVIQIFVSEALDTSDDPATGDFSVSGTSGVITHVSVGLGTSILVTLDADIGSWETVKISYTAGSNPVQDVAGNALADFTNEAVTNNAARVTAYQAVYDSWTGKPVAAVDIEYDRMVATMVAAGTWAKKDINYVFAAHTNDNGEALKNWFNPGTFDATLINAPAFVAFEGFTSDGESSYIRLNWIPATNGINYLKDSASIGVYSRTDNLGAVLDIGSQDGDSYTPTMGIRWTGGHVFLKLNDNTHTPTSGSPTSLGDFIGSREGAAIKRAYRNKVRTMNLTTASIGVSSIELYALCYNSNLTPANYTTRQLSRAFAGGALTQADVNAETDSFEAYMDSNGKGVIA